MPSARSLVARGTLLVGLVAGGLAGCGGGSSTSGCGPVRREALDPGYLQHVLPGGRATYSTDPPTSGPHQPAPRIPSVQRTPIPKPVQVGLLEDGEVVVQYRGLAAGDVRQVRALAGKDVVVAPAPSLPGDARVVATAWTYKRTCTEVDVGALRDFITERVGKGPGSDG